MENQKTQFDKEIDLLRRIGKSTGVIPSVYLILNDGSESEKSKMVSLLTDTLYENGLREFLSLDRSLESRLSGKPGCVDFEFAMIHSKSVMSNEYNGVLGLDITELLKSPLQGEQKRLLCHIAENAENITFILFVDRSVGEKRFRKFEEYVSNIALTTSMILPEVTRESTKKFVVDKLKNADLIFSPMAEDKLADYIYTEAISKSESAGLKTVAMLFDSTIYTLYRRAESFTSESMEKELLIMCGKEE